MRLLARQLLRVPKIMSEHSDDEVHQGRRVI